MEPLYTLLVTLPVVRTLQTFFKISAFVNGVLLLCCVWKKKSCVVYIMLFLIIPNNSCCSFYFANVVFLLLPLLHFTAHPASMGQTKLLNLEKDGSRSISSLPLTWASLLTAAPHLLSVSRTRLPSGKRPKTNSVPLLTPTTARFGTARPRRPWLPPAIHWTHSTRCDLLVWDHVLLVFQKNSVGPLYRER